MTVVALFGGSFNPPHIAHQMVCLYLLETAGVDEVWLVPTFRHPFAKQLAPFEDRFNMCELAAAVLGGRVKVSRIEETLAAENPEVSRTVNTIKALAERHPGSQFRLVVGADILQETDKWYRWDEIERIASPIVVGRPGYPYEDTPALAEVSSTEVRRRLASGENALPLVSRSVIDYIAERGLYR